MNIISLNNRRLAKVVYQLVVGTCIALPVWAQEAATATATSARPGTPSVLSAVDTLLRAMGAQFQKFGPYALAAIAIVAAYLTGLILFQILFASGSFAPRAASNAAWVASLVLLFFGLMMMPLTWPWWSPYAVLFGGILVIFMIISSLSKKTA